MKKIVIASQNKGKIREFKEMLEPKGYEVLSLLDMPLDFDIEETGTTFEENAIIKAKTVSDYYQIDAIADDSGIEIEAFDNGPGIYSSRWLGEDTPYSEKNQIVLDKLKDEENRKCRYVCCIAVVELNKEPIIFKGTVDCTIAYEPKGENGFGYDPIVYYEEFHKTMAEMSDEEKNSISHRGKAVRQLEEWLDENQ